MEGRLYVLFLSVGYVTLVVIRNLSFRKGLANEDKVHTWGHQILALVKVMLRIVDL